MGVKPRVLQQLLLLPRAELSLSHLDLSSANGELPPGRFVESHVKILDLESRVGGAPVVLIARNEPVGTLYAIERHDKNLYTACKLGSWVSLEALKANATACSAKLLHEQPRKCEGTAGQPPKAPVLQSKKRVAIEAIQQLVRKKPKIASISSPAGETQGSVGGTNEADVQSQGSLQLEESQSQSQVESQSQGLPAPVDNQAEPPPADHLENIRTQYFDLLYKSMVRIPSFAALALAK